MRSPELTYAYTSSMDTSDPTLQIVNRTEDVTDTSVLLQFNLAGIPKDKFFILSHAMIVAQPGVGQDVTNLAIKGTTPALNLFNIQDEQFIGAAREPASMVFDGEVWIRGSGGVLSTVTLTALFDAGVAANVARFGISGFLVPRGNVADF